MYHILSPSFFDRTGVTRHEHAHVDLVVEIRNRHVASRPIACIVIYEILKTESRYQLCETHGSMQREKKDAKPLPRTVARGRGVAMLLLPPTWTLLNTWAVRAIMPGQLKEARLELETRYQVRIMAVGW